VFASVNVAARHLNGGEAMEGVALRRMRKLVSTVVRVLARGKGR
jgi:hypothetical protein